MAININHYPGREFYLIEGLTPAFAVDLNQSVKEKLKEGERLTNETALKIFKKIKWKSDVLSFLSKPVVLISAAVTLSAIAFSSPVATGLALKIIRSVFFAFTGAFFGYSIWSSLNGSLSQISQAYKEQSERANKHIKTIEAADHELEFNLACEFYDNR